MEHNFDDIIFIANSELGRFRNKLCVEEKKKPVWGLVSVSEQGAKPSTNFY